MSTHKHIDQICCVVLVLTLLISGVLMVASASGIRTTSRTVGYENRLFDASKVHTVDIVMNDWESFIERCTDEEYTACTVIIDGETYKNVAIRAKGNTSLTQVKLLDSDRYSFKIEFDHYDSSKTYHGLDKLCLNNIIQDNTYMKDFLTYQMMNAFGVSAPLCSYAAITVNGNDWGFYLAVEAIEESFLTRNYGTNYGELYKPDSLTVNGGNGSGMDVRNDNRITDLPVPTSGEFEISEVDRQPSDRNNPIGENSQSRSMGSNDVALIYSDDDFLSYSNIFENAKTEITDADKQRLVASLKAMNEQTDLEHCVDTEAVIRYFIVHNFVVNFDSYTGSMIHNYYLYEKDGQLSMLPWDYNLAFGGFQSSSDATSLVNYPIDSPVSGGTIDSRPMLAWIFSDDEYTAQYHSLFSEWIAEYFESGAFSENFDYVKELIAPYVERDTSKFCTYSEFLEGTDTLKEFCLLRAESIRGQLNGTIGSTTEAQTDRTNLVNADHLSVSAMGTMNQTENGETMPGEIGKDFPPSMPNGDSSLPLPSAPAANVLPTSAVQTNEQQLPNVPDNTELFGGTPPSATNPPDWQNGGNPQSSANSSPSGSIGSARTGFSFSEEAGLLIASTVVLIGGLAFACLFKRRK